MRLINKKTGEIMELSVKCENGGELRTFDLNTNTDKPITLAELNEEWEDVPEEPKEYWCIDWTGGLNHITLLDDSTDKYEKAKKQIGNYFESKEEAEKAVEKLKAVKRLKDKGVEFYGWRRNHTGTYDLLVRWEDRIPRSYEIKNDLNLLFGDEK